MTTDAQGIIARQTYCTSCKQNVQITDGKYMRLANNRAVIKGRCSLCGAELIKAKLMSRNSFFVKRKRKGLLK